MSGEKGMEGVEWMYLALDVGSGGAFWMWY
jgi:hypothetical protein